MNAKERKQEDAEIAQAVKVLRAAIQSIARRKARNYELELLRRVRDEVDCEINNCAAYARLEANFISDNIKRELTKQ